MDKISIFLANINIKPNNLDVYVQAFTHPSFANENRGSKSYQRLEYLGDGLLKKLVVEKAYFDNPSFDEGKLTDLSNAALNGPTLTKFATELNLKELIRFGKTIENLSTNKHILEDVFEALIGALYVDQGEQVVKKFLSTNIFKFIDEIKNVDVRNPKTILQEYLQSESRETIQYVTVEIEEGFEATIIHDGTRFGKGVGKTKKEAEVNAAKQALELLGDVKPKGRK